MVLRLLAALPVAGLDLARALPTEVSRQLAPARLVSAVESAARTAGDLAGSGVRAASASVDALADPTARVARVVRNALTPGRGYWSAGSRLHLALVPERADAPDAPGALDVSDALDEVEQAAAHPAVLLEDAAEEVAAALADHPEVVSAYWDGGLERLVVELAEDAVTDRVADRAGELAANCGLRRADEQVLERVHPGHTGGVRIGAIALACDVAGIAGALSARAVRLSSAPRLATSLVTLLREDSRVRSALSGRLGAASADLVLAVANAAAHGIGQSPDSLVLDAGLRVSQWIEAVARAAAFDAAHDQVCAPGKASLGGSEVVRPALHASPARSYADQAVSASLVGAAATLLFTRDVQETAEAVLAGSPKAARYGPSGFTAVLATALARDGVLVRSTERLQQLETVDTLVLHAEALRGGTRTVLEVHPSIAQVDHDALWQAAVTALRRSGPASSGAATDEDDEVSCVLRPVPDGLSSDTGLMIASRLGVDLGTVLVGWEVDPLADAALHAARRAGLHVVVVDDGSLGEFATLADERVGAERPLADVVAELRARGRVVLTVARIATDARPAGRHSRGRASARADHRTQEILAGLLGSDVAVSLTDDRSAVVWGSDLIALNGLAGVWRLLAAVPAAHTVAHHCTLLAKAGASLSGLLVVTRGSRDHRSPLPLAWRLSPVNAAAAASLVLGWYAAVDVGVRGTPHPRPRIAWHALQPREALSRLRAAEQRVPSAASPHGQASGRGAARLWSLPALAPARHVTHLLGAAWAELDDPLTPVLAVGAIASALLGSSVDALLVAGAMVVNAAVGGVQRLRAERALSALVEGERPTARRVSAGPAPAGAEPGSGTGGAPGGGTSTVEANQLTPGHVIDLQTGDVVPADARLLEVDALEVDESALTGESLPTTKQVDATPHAAVADRRCMVFQGTTVVAGHGRAVVVDTGDDTEAGRAAHLASRTAASAGVQARLRELTNRALPLTLAGGAAVTGLSLLRGRPVRESVRGGLAVAVAAVPEGLPLVATVAQLAAARRLSRCGILVRTPRTLEALGRMDTICFDKTGTLTQNRLRVVRVVGPDGSSHDAAAAEAGPVLRAAARACPHIVDEQGIHAHATDEAILAAARPEPSWVSSGALPFSSERGYASATGTDGTGTRLLVVKGAPEAVLPCCPDAGAEATSAAQALAGQGLRVLAVAARRLDDLRPSDAGAGTSEAPEGGAEALDKPLEGLDLLGFVALADTPRPSSGPLVAALRDAGVRPVMLTGDHPQTARAIAVDLGWPDDVVVVTGEELATQDRAGRARLLGSCGVVARVAPEQKLQVVEGLREAGHVIAMVGDGSNDAAAIRCADIGIGIASRGSAAARNAADLVITGDELTTLLDAVAEGRALWRSVADAVSILIGGNAGEIGFSLFGALTAGASPLSTRQLLLVNLLTDMFPAMAVAVTPRSEASAQDRAPAGTAAPTGAGPVGPVGLEALGEPLMREIRHRGIITGIGAATAWLIGALTPGTTRRSSTMALCGVVGAQLIQTVAGRRSSPLVLATALGSAAVLVALIQTPVVSQFFGCTPLGPLAWAGVAAAITAAALAGPVLPAAERLLGTAGARLLPRIRVVS
ncbi:cation-translocating P-type ATPase [Streptacidiphilus fuscans]|uniref:Cation-translocating P-type ATPase n=1 Tax=Streptacidiphilus fuscans TaxID=2789292 RepID=A0A931FDX8_9ACTN|nr:cation-translocating P-type ATPase [Streptacidiphilus fuscans]MBF9066964.1 cation-translocating P-type ATPase [Streptacidiphilus fuscans]